MKIIKYEGKKTSKITKYEGEKGSKRRKEENKKRRKEGRKKEKKEATMKCFPKRVHYKHFSRYHAVGLLLAPVDVVNRGENKHTYLHTTKHIVAMFSM